MSSPSVERASRRSPQRLSGRHVDELDLRDFIDGQSAFYAGTANVIMQLGRPAVGYGVYESTVDSGNILKVPRKRARTTITYLAVALLGTDEERAAYRDAVNGQHRHVRTQEGSPVRYNAFDPELQLWVAACLSYGARDVRRRLHGPMDPAHEQWFYEQTSRFATTLQVRPESWPATLEDFDAYWADGLHQVHYSPEIRDYLLGLLDLAQLPERQRRRLGSFHRWVNTGFLPPEFREALDLEWSARDEARFTARMEAAGRRNQRVPRPVAMFPFNAVLADFRVRRRLGLDLV